MNLQTKNEKGLRDKKTYLSLKNNNEKTEWSDRHIPEEQEDFVIEAW